MYNFTSFAMVLNEVDKEMESVIPKTDCRLRPDIRAMENGEIGKEWLSCCGFFVAAGCLSPGDLVSLGTGFFQAPSDIVTFKLSNFYLSRLD